MTHQPASTGGQIKTYEIQFRDGRPPVRVRADSVTEEDGVLVFKIGENVKDSFPLNKVRGYPEITPPLKRVTDASRR